MPSRPSMRRLVAAQIILAVVVIGLAGYAFLADAAKVNDIRGVFCDWTTVHVQILRNHHAGYVNSKALQSDRALLRQLNCPR